MRACVAKWSWASRWPVSRRSWICVDFSMGFGFPRTCLQSGMIAAMNTSRSKRDSRQIQMPLLMADHMQACVQAKVLGNARITLAKLILEAARGVEPTITAEVKSETS